MNKNYKNLTAGNTTGINFENPSEKAELFREIEKGLEGPAEANKDAVAAWGNWEKETGEEPTSPGEAGAPDKPISLAIREGDILPSDSAKDLFSATMGQEMPGTGLASDKEIQAADEWEGFRASDYQSGKEQSSFQQLEMEEQGREPESPNKSDSFGAGKIFKGLREGNPMETLKGMTELGGMGRDLLTESYIHVGKTLNNAVWDLALGMAKNLPEGHPARNLYEGGKELIDDGERGARETVGKFGKLTDTLAGVITGDKKAAGQLADMLKPNNIESSILEAFQATGKKKKGQEQEQEDPKNDKKPEGDNKSALLAGALARSITFKASRRRGVPSKDAGPAAEEAGKAAEEVTRNDGKSKAANKAIELGTATKNVAAKVASKAALAIPGVGPLISGAIIVADIATDMVAESMKKQGPDQEKGGTESQQMVAGATSSPTKKKGVGGLAAKAILKKIPGLEQAGGLAEFAGDQAQGLVAKGVEKSKENSNKKLPGSQDNLELDKI